MQKEPARANHFFGQIKHPNPGGVVKLRMDFRVRHDNVRA
jgi:hypothetical protein